VSCSTCISYDAVLTRRHIRQFEGEENIANLMKLPTSGFMKEHARDAEFTRRRLREILYVNK
jgi:hypothetical protein